MVSSATTTPRGSPAIPASLPKLLQSFRAARSTPVASAAKPITRAEAMDSIGSLRKLLNRPVPPTTPTGFVTVQKVLFTEAYR